MIQPISQSYGNNIIYKKNLKKAVKPVEMNYNLLNKDVEVVEYLKTVKQQNETKNKLLLTGIGTIGVGALLVSASILNKGSSRNSVSRNGRGLVKDFESLTKDNKIPVLDKCKSINEKMRTFLQKQVNYAKANKVDIEKTGMPQPANKLLLYGPPGTGKSYFAKIYAKTLGAEYTEIKFSDFNSQWCGEHIENLKSVFETILAKATAEPNKKFVVTLNEIDAILLPAESLMRAGTGHSMFKLEERSTFLNCFDEIAAKAPNVTIIGTTNISPKDKGLDGAAMSRFKNIIGVDYPDKTCLYEALKANLLELKDGKKFVDKNNSKLEKFAANLADRQSSFRDLDNIIDSSKNYYLDDYMKNKNAQFKYEYLEKAKNGLELTDGEINSAK